MYYKMVKQSWKLNNNNKDSNNTVGSIYAASDGGVGNVNNRNGDRSQRNKSSSINNTSNQMTMLAIDLVSIELFLLIFMVCFVNNICNGVVAVGNGPNIANSK